MVRLWLANALNYFTRLKTAGLPFIMTRAVFPSGFGFSVHLCSWKIPVTQEIPSAPTEAGKILLAHPEMLTVFWAASITTVCSVIWEADQIIVPIHVPAYRPFC